MAQYGHESKDLRQARLLECTRRLTKLNCVSREKIPTFVLELDHLFGEFEALDCEYPEPLKKLTLMERIEGTAPDVYGSVIKDEALSYAALIATVKRMTALDSAMSRAIKTEELESQAFPIKTYRQSLPQRWKISWRPERDQCLWCLKKGHRLADCRSKANGEPSRIRPDGSRFEDHAKPRAKEQDAFAAQCFATQAQGKKGKKQQSWLVDSGCNKHMTPFLEDLQNVIDDNTQCRFGDSATARAEGKGNILLECSNGKEENVNVMMTDVLYMPLLPYRILSTPCLRKAGGRYMDSPNKPELVFGSGRRLPLTERNDFHWLEGNGISLHDHGTIDTHSNTLAATVFAPGARETAQASLIDWHESLGHSHPSSILFLEQRGLIKVTGEKSLDGFNCRICNEAKSTVLHYQRGTRSIKVPER